MGLPVAGLAMLVEDWSGPPAPVRLALLLGVIAVAVVVYFLTLRVSGLPWRMLRGPG